uniref:Fucosyltransferase n=1 Tax=Araucaria cunninghamii TaxID=56994 RepID=A0A0D6R620_ARACU
MDMARFRGHPSQAMPEDSEIAGSRIMEKKPGVNVTRMLCIVVVCFFVLPAFVTFSYNGVSQHPPAGKDQIRQLPHNVARTVKEADGAVTQSKENDLNDQNGRQMAHADESTRVGGLEEDNGTGQIRNQGSYGDSTVKNLENMDPSLDGLLADGYSKGTCRSRDEVYRYRKASIYKPSAYLLARLRKYEALHGRCGPNTESFKRSLNDLKSGKTPEDAECQYIVWVSYSGLGNRIVTIAATFLYALLTNRVLLIDKGVDMRDLFCEPFPNTSWFLPSSFPMTWLEPLNETSTQRFGHLLNNSIIQLYENSTQNSLPHYVYLHLNHKYDFYDKLFFCEREQRFLEHIPWLFLKSNNYFVPNLYLIPPFNEELQRLFPQKDSIFHHLGRYLFHPSNSVWGLITRFYQAYMAYGEQRIGMQIRTFDPGYFPYITDEVLACSLKYKILPNISNSDEELEGTYENGEMKKPYAVLVTSLSSGYYERIRSMYWEHPTVDGQVVSVFQPSHEEWQQTEKHSHNMKAWAEMYLLSLCDVLITSPWSTFGYVAQGLAGIKPWILFKPENGTVPDPPCRKVMSIEPCFHAPPFYDCQQKRGIDTGKVFPYVRHCEDVPWGLKVVENDEL